jgi:hypothetical protein
MRATPGFIRNELAKQFFGRDLFDYRLPLEHDTYFSQGRRGADLPPMRSGAARTGAFSD